MNAQPNRPAQPSFVTPKMKTCLHGMGLQYNCALCQFERAKASQSGVCSHWILKSDYCYACQRTKQRSNPFQKFNQKDKFQQKQPSYSSTHHSLPKQKNYHPTQPHYEKKTERFNPMGNRMFPQHHVGTVDPVGQKIPQGYTHPDVPQKYPQVSNWGNQQTRNKTHRATYKKEPMGAFMNRSLETVDILSQQNPKSWSHNSWGQFRGNSQQQGSLMDYHQGVNTRGNHRTENMRKQQDLFLQRSLVQPDIRVGNRFFEEKPSDTRRARFSTISNQRSQTRQQQSVYQSNYSRAMRRAYPVKNDPFAKGNHLQ